MVSGTNLQMVQQKMCVGNNHTTLLLPSPTRGGSSRLFSLQLLLLLLVLVHSVVFLLLAGVVDGQVTANRLLVAIADGNDDAEQYPNGQQTSVGITSKQQKTTTTKKNKNQQTKAFLWKNYDN